MERVQRVVKTVEPHDSVERYTSLGVECLQGEAKITSPWSVEIKRADGGKQTLTTRAIVIAAGARPFVPPIPGIEEVGYVTSDTVWDLRDLPRRLVVLGGGPIGCELAQCFARLGSKVTQVEMLPRIMIREDPEISEMVAHRFREEGIDVLVDHKAKAFRVENGEKVMVAEHDGKDVAHRVRRAAVRGRARRQHAGLRTGGARHPGDESSARSRSTSTCRRSTRTSTPAATSPGPYQFTHTAVAHGVVLRGERAVRPLQEIQGRLLGHPVGDLHRARSRARRPERDRGEGEAASLTKSSPMASTTSTARSPTARPQGMVKVLTVPGKDRILGVTIAGEHAGDLIAEYVAAMKHGFGLNKILGTIHIYPTLAEANKYAAGVWKRAHAPQGMLEVASASRLDARRGRPRAPSRKALAMVATGALLRHRGAGPRRRLERHDHGPAAALALSMRAFARRRQVSTTTHKAWNALLKKHVRS